MDATRISTAAARRLARRSLLVLTVTGAAAGCASSDGLGERDARALPADAADATTRPVVPLLTFQTFAVTALPPAGWSQRTLMANDRAEHVAWISPSGHTAYGIIFFHLPFPVGHEIAFSRGVLAEIRKRDGEPEVLAKYWDDEIGGLRFAVRSPKYTIDAKLFVRGLRGYMVYAGTLTQEPIDEPELVDARRARESTRFAHEVKTPTTKPSTRPAPQ